MFEPPDGYVLLDGFENYKLSHEAADRIRVKGYNNWMPIHDWRGMTPKQIVTKYSHVIEAVAIKGKPKPRFEPKKPYPHGY